MSDLLKLKAYRILAQEYKNLYTAILTRARNASEFGQKDDQVKVIQTIIEVDNYQTSGIQSHEKGRLVRTLEYLLDDSQPVK